MRPAKPYSCPPTQSPADAGGSMQKRRKVLAVAARRGEHEEAAEDDSVGLERERQEAAAAARRAGTARGGGSGPARGARGGGGGRRRRPRAGTAGGGGGCPAWGRRDRRRRDGKRYIGGQRWELMIGPAAVSFFGGVGDGDRLRLWHRSRGGRRTKTVAALPQSGHIFFQPSHLRSTTSIPLRLTFVLCCHQ